MTHDARVVAAGARTAPGSHAHPFRVRFARFLLARAGWRVRFDGLPGPRGIVIVYPHTSNWDFVIGLLAKWEMDLPFRWIGKESLFRGLTGATLGRWLRRIGGRPVDRHQTSGTVERLKEEVLAEPWFWLAIAPEGTRRRSEFVRSGFYHLAFSLDVPLALAFIDYGTRTVGMTEFVRMTGNVENDLEVLRTFYADKRPLHAGQESRIAFRT